MVVVVIEAEDLAMREDRLITATIVIVQTLTEQGETRKDIGLVPVIWPIILLIYISPH
jgi:hypothetical protein